MAQFALASHSTALPQAQQQDRPSLRLWDRARASLPADVQPLVDFNHTDRRRVLDDVLQLAEDKRKQCIKSRWKITRSNGEVIVLRDVFEKVASFAHTFREVGDVAVQYDPGHAALPWAGVRFVLQIVISETSAFAALMDGLEKVTNYISRYAIVEALYLREWSAPADHLANSLTAMYAAILTFLGKSIKFFADGTAKRMVKNSLGATDRIISDLTATISQRQMQVEWDASLVQGFRQLGMIDTTMALVTQSAQAGLGAIIAELQRLERNTMAMNSETRADIAKLLQLTQRLAVPSHRLAVPLQDVKDDRSEAQRLELLRWVSMIPFEQHHNNIRKSRIATTGQWLFAKDEFQQWRLSSSSSILWVHGLPGAGKTVLTSAVIDQILNEQNVDDTSPPVAIFYCSRNPAEPERAMPREVFASIARQLSGQNCSLPIRLPLQRAFEKIKGKGFEARKMDLDETISLITALNNDNPSVIVIDGLDECNATLRHELLEGLDKILRWSLNVVKVFVTSRPDHDIVCRLRSVPNIYIKAADNEVDIQNFVEAELSLAIENKRLLHGDVSLDLRTKIDQSLNDGAQGMFRWVSLQLQNLCNPQRMKIEADVVSELGKMPKTLADTYDVIYDQVSQSGNASKQLAQSALQWMMVAQRQLTPEELATALSNVHADGTIRVRRDEISTLTCNLLVIDEFLNTVRFAHTSVREYLESRSEFSLEECHLYVGSACLSCFGDEIDHDIDKHKSGTGLRLRTPKSPSSYATLYWPVHASQIRGLHLRGEIIKVLNDIVLDRLSPSRSFTLWRSCIFEATKNFEVFDDSLYHALQACVTPFHTSCVFGFHELIKCNQAQVEAYNYTYEESTATSPFHGLSAFQMAIRQGHYGVVNAILTIGVDVHRNTPAGWTPIYIAVRADKDDLISLLARFGADPNRSVPLPQLKRNVPYSLSYDDHREFDIVSARRRDTATRMGRRSVDGRTTSALDDEIETPLHHAAARGYRKCIVELVKHGADVDITTNTGATPLMAALENSKYSTIQLLLDEGASINKTLLYGRAVLHLAAARGDVTAVGVLISLGADPYQPDWLGSTASDLARQYQHDEVVKMLPALPLDRVVSSPTTTAMIVNSDNGETSDDEQSKPIFKNISAFTSEQQLPSIIVSEWVQIKSKAPKRKLVPANEFFLPPTAKLKTSLTMSINRRPLSR